MGYLALNEMRERPGRFTEVGGSGRGLFQCTIQTLAWRDWGK